MLAHTLKILTCLIHYILTNLPIYIDKMSMGLFRPIKTRNCVYKTLCPQPLACPPSCSPGKLFTTLLQLTKSEATSFYSFRDIFIGSS